MARHIMVDIETLGKGNSCMLWSLGAVLFDGDNILDKFEVAIDVVDAERYGLKIDAPTVLYWFDETRNEARKQIMAMPPVDLFAALDGFAIWVQQTPTGERGSLWGKGSTFDNVRIKSAYEAVGLDYPFNYRQDECYRTMANRCPEVKFLPYGTAHNHLDDAIAQTLHLQAICKHLGIVL